MNKNLQQQVEDEMRRVVALVEETTGLRSRWSGRIVLESSATQAQRGRQVLGEKRWNCDILMQQDLCDSPRRWRTLLHELFHSVSVGTNESDYQRFRGWEEGTVEWLQRRHRLEVLRSLGITVSGEVFAAVKEFWPMNSYLEALQALQEACVWKKTDFTENYFERRLHCVLLLSVPGAISPTFCLCLHER